MPTYYPSIPADLVEWSMSQLVFWTATAPRAGKHINVSPKGYATFTVLGPNECAYLDHTGSGAETIAHLYENGRITLAWCSFGPSPRIMRVWCTGRVVEAGEKGFETLMGRMREVQKKYGVDLGYGEKVDGVRAIVHLDVYRCGTSCGYGVPLVSPTGAFVERPTMDKFSNHLSEKGDMMKYRADWNVRSHDGLTGLRAARREKGEWLVLGDGLAWARMMWGMRDAVLVGVILGVLMMLLVQRVQSLGGVRALLKL